MRLPETKNRHFCRSNSIWTTLTVRRQDSKLGFAQSYLVARGRSSMNQKEAVRVLRDALERCNLKRTLQFSEQTHANAGNPDVDMDELRQACEAILRDPDPSLLDEVGGRETVERFMSPLPPGQWVPQTPPTPPQAASSPPPGAATRVGASNSSGGELLVAASLVLFGIAVGASLASAPPRRR